jgi:CBS-domain-containing membrane protein
MLFTNWLKKERRIWHKRFIPSLVTGIAVTILTIFFEMTVSNIILFASLGASAAILTTKKIHPLNVLRTVIISYVIALVVSSLLLFVSHHLFMPFSVSVLMAVTLVTLAMYLFNVFHPPAVAASISFLVYDAGFYETFLIFISVIIMMILIKFLTYAFYYEELKMHKFHLEFKKIEGKVRK